MPTTSEDFVALTDARSIIQISTNLHVGKPELTNEPVRAKAGIQQTAANNSVDLVHIDKCNQFLGPEGDTFPNSAN